MRTRPSLQNRLILSAILTVIALGAISSYVTYRVVKYRLTRAFDDTLESKARALLSLTKVERDGGFEFEFASDSMPEFASQSSPEYFLLIASDGSVLARSPSLGTADLTKTALNRVTSEDTFDRPLPDGRMGRVLAMRGFPVVERDSENEDGSPSQQAVASFVPAPIWVVVARERAPLDRSLRHVSVALAFGTLFLGFASTMVLTLVMRYGLNPLRKLAADVESVDITNMETRFLTPRLPRELTPIAERLDELFTRLRKAIARERRYTSDVAHELRTPLSEISVALEIAEKFANLGDEARIAIKQALEATAECRTLVETLLEVARHGDNARKPPMAPVDVVRITREEYLRLRDQASAKKLHVLQRSDTERALVLSNEHLLRAIVRNLLGNAVDYAPEESEVVIEVCQDPVKGGRLSISNVAKDLAATDLDSMTEPFWRKDAARTDRQHSGLGLTLAKSIAKLLDLELSLNLSAEQIFTVALQWSAVSNTVGECAHLTGGRGDEVDTAAASE